MGITPDYQRRAADKYLSKMARVVLVISPYDKDRIYKASADAGQSMTAFIMDAVNSRIIAEQDGPEIPADLIARLLEWLKGKGLSDADIVDCIEYINKTE